MCGRDQIPVRSVAPDVAAANLEEGRINIAVEVGAGDTAKNDPVVAQVPGPVYLEAVATVIVIIDKAKFRIGVAQIVSRRFVLLREGGAMHQAQRRDSVNPSHDLLPVSEVLLALH